MDAVQQHDLIAGGFDFWIVAVTREPEVEIGLCNTNDRSQTCARQMMNRQVLSLDPTADGTSRNAAKRGNCLNAQQMIVRGRIGRTVKFVELALIVH